MRKRPTAYILDLSMRCPKYMLYWRRRSKLLAQNLNSISKTCCKIGCLVGDIIFGTNILSSVPDAVGLNHFGVELPSKETFDETMKHISQYDGANVEEKSSSPLL